MNLAEMWRTYRSAMIVSAAIAVIIGLFDFVTRVVVLRDDTLRQFTVPELKKPLSSPSLESIQQQMATWFPAPPAPEPPPPQMVLQGILGVGDTAKVALVTMVGAQVTERRLLKRGEIMGDWTVEAIGRGKVTLRRGAESQELVLFRTQVE